MTRALPDDETRRVGVIDIGSNSVRFVAYEIYGVATTPVFNEKLLAGLGRNIGRTGQLYPDGVARSVKALARFKALAEAQGLNKILVVATAAVREASDGPAFVRRVKTETGIKIRVLSGEEEAYFSALGVINGDRRSAGVVADLGGASLELIRIKDQAASDGRTFALGPFAALDDPAKPMAARSLVRKRLADAKDHYDVRGGQLYLVGGAWRRLAQIHNERKGYPLRILQSFEMRSQEATALGKWASEEAASDLLNWPGISDRRAETLPYAGLVMVELIRALKPDTVVFSSSGLREGLLYDSLTAKVKKRVPLHDACAHLAAGNQQGRDFGPGLFQWLKAIAPHLPGCFDEENETRLRRAACDLVGIGKGLHPDHRADLVFEDVLYAPLAGLNHKERAYLALMLYGSFTGRDSTPNDAAIHYHLMARERQYARIWGAAMRAGSVIAGRTPGILKYFKLSFDEGSVHLKVKRGHEELLNRKAILRLQKMTSLAGYSLKTNWVAAGQDESD
ncbi:Ppx/GppA family phosphatase [Robiginitomaculum antarcticum]|uniref:Ppx/GppA family phosphatase n=1 Tax=Robiginitomaculum antarcticum TaxID=437507 RepID=UPI00036994C1|nr:Ppx/GppA family phosphatase [Robiginitomaculum antarcticum]